MKAIDASKHPPPEPFNHEEIHAFFKEPEITPVVELQEKGLLVWKPPDFDGECVRVSVRVSVCERVCESVSFLEVYLALGALERSYVTIGLWRFGCRRRGFETERLLTVMVCVCV